MDFNFHIMFSLVNVFNADTNIRNKVLSSLRSDNSAVFCALTRAALCDLTIANNC